MFAQPLFWFVWRSQWHDPNPGSRFTFVVLIHCLAVQSSYEQSGNLLNGSMWTKWPVKFAVWTKLLILTKRFSYDLGMKTREQNRNNKRTEIQHLTGLSNGYKRAWLLVGSANAPVKKLHAREIPRNQSILRFDVILRHVGQSNKAFSRSRAQKIQNICNLFPPLR